MAAAINLLTPHFRHSQGVGYRLYAFRLGSTTIPVSTYADPDGNSPNLWPVILADAGEGDGIALIYVTESVTLELQNAAGVTQPGYPADFIRGVTIGELAAVEQTVTTRLDEHDAALYLLQSRASVLEDRATAVEDRAALLESRATSLESRATSLESRATSLESRATSLESRATSLEGRMTTAEDQIVILNNAAETAQTNITTLQGQMTTATGNITTLQNQMVTANNRLNELNDDMTVAQTAITTLQSQMTAANNALTLHDNAITALQTAVAGFVLAAGGSNYFWDKESQTLTTWGTFSTAANGRVTVSYPVAYDAIPSVTVTTLAAAYFVSATLTAITTTTFDVYAARIDGDGPHVTTVDGRWLAIGKKAG